MKVSDAVEIVEKVLVPVAVRDVTLDAIDQIADATPPAGTAAGILPPGASSVVGALNDDATAAPVAYSPPHTIPDEEPYWPAKDAVGRKHDGGKLRWDLLPLVATSEVVAVLTYGASKYDDENWRKVPDRRRRYYAAAMRHLVAWFLGERADPETGLHHLAHAACCVLFLLDEEVPK